MMIDILVGLGVVIAAFIVIVASRPPNFRITRSAAIGAGAAEVFAQVNDLHRWEAWSPWAKLDPNIKNTYEGSPAGVGAALAWSGNNKVGAGKMLITDSRPNDLIRLQLDFLRPFKASNVAEFTFKPDAAQTMVTWIMTGRSNFISKAMGLFMNFDKMIGGDFEKGLQQLDSVLKVEIKK
jgi:hypothetical protein